MAWMAGRSGSILAVGLLGCTRICQTAKRSSIARLSGTYRTVVTDRVQTGALCPRAPARWESRDHQAEQRSSWVPHQRRGPCTVVRQPPGRGAPEFGPATSLARRAHRRLPVRASSGPAWREGPSAASLSRCRQAWPRLRSWASRRVGRLDRGLLRSRDTSHTN
jgi:hypothetical protein